MNFKINYFIKSLSAVLLCLSFTSADVLCVRNKAAVVGGSINLKANVKRVTGSTCPARHTLLMDLSNLVGETGNLPNAAAGKTFTGTFATGGKATAVGDYVSDSINFPTKLTNRPIPRVVELSGAATAQCPGSFSNPQASPGYLCFYVGDASRVASHSVWDPITSNNNESSVYGAALYAYADGIGLYYSWGTWALTTN